MDNYCPEQVSSEYTWSVCLAPVWLSDDVIVKVSPVQLRCSLGIPTLSFLAVSAPSQFRVQKPTYVFVEVADSVVLFYPEMKCIYRF